MAAKEQQKEFIEKIAPIAQKAYKQFGKPLPSICIAMAAVECRWGLAGSCKHHSYLGQKVGTGRTATKYWSGKGFNAKTQEVTNQDTGALKTIRDNFRAYDSMEQCVFNYYELLNTGLYDKVQYGADYKNQMKQIKACGYMTSVTEVNSCLSIIDKYGLIKYDDVVQNKTCEVLIGSARVDENGLYVGGSAGDQTGKEVSVQDFYNHSKGWYVLRAKSDEVADNLASAMQAACDNQNIGYDQGQRLDVITQIRKFGSLGNIAVNTEADCSSLVRACCIEAGFDPGNFTTANEVAALEGTGRFEKKESIAEEEQLRKGDILVTKTKGHTAVVVDVIEKNLSNTRPTLRRGDRGEDVVYLQTRLTAMGYSVGKIDGIFGINTLEAVKAFQVENGLSVDGIVGAKTWAVIG